MTLVVLFTGAVRANGVGRWTVFAPQRVAPVLYRPSGIAVDPTGRVYVADTATNIVHVLSPHGRPLAAWKGGLHPLHAPTTLVFGPRGRLYVMNSGDGTIASYTPSGSFQAAWSVRPGGGALPLAVDPAGAVWTAQSAGAAVRVTSFLSSEHRRVSWIAVVKHPPDLSFSCAAPSGVCPGDLLVQPLGIAIHEGSVFLLLQGQACGGGGKGTCRSSYVLQRRSPTGQLLHEWLVTTASATFSLEQPAGLAFGRGGDALLPIGAAVLAMPLDDTATPRVLLNRHGSDAELGGIAVGAGGSVFLTDPAEQTVTKRAWRGGAVQTWGTPISRSFGEMNAVAVNAAGDVYVTTSRNRQIVELSPGGRVMTNWVPDAMPTALAVATNGDVYAACVAADLRQIEVFSPDGALLHRWGSGGTTPGALDDPVGLAVDASGDAYVADIGTDRVQEFGADGHLKLTWGGLVGGTTDAGVPGTPTALAIDSAGDLYVADGGDGRVLRRSPSGATVAIALPPSLSDSAGVPPSINGIAVDPSGNLWLTAHPAQVIELSQTGVLLARWTTTGQGPGQFERPADIAVAGDGMVYVTDLDNHWIQARHDGT
jgi:DNA-binding beta-propeller fold protein YncE